MKNIKTKFYNMLKEINTEYTKKELFNEFLNYGFDDFVYLKNDYGLWILGTSADSDCTSCIEYDYREKENFIYQFGWEAIIIPEELLFMYYNTFIVHNLAYIK